LRKEEILRMIFLEWILLRSSEEVANMEEVTLTKEQLLMKAEVRRRVDYE